MAVIPDPSAQQSQAKKLEDELQAEACVTSHWAQKYVPWCTRPVLQVCFIQITVDDPKGTWIATLVTSMWKIPNPPRLLETWDEGFFFPPPRGDKYLADLAAFRGMDLKESQELISHYQDPCRLRNGEVSPVSADSAVEDHYVPIQMDGSEDSTPFIHMMWHGKQVYFLGLFVWRLVKTGRLARKLLNQPNTSMQAAPVVESMSYIEWFGIISS